MTENPVPKPRGTILSKNRASQLCFEWYGGQWTALYSFASSKKYLEHLYPTYSHEIQSCEPATLKQKKELKSLQRFFDYKHWEANEDSFIRDLDILDLDPEKKDLILALHNRVMDPESFLSVRKWVDKCFNRPSHDEMLMKAYDELLEGYGIEAHSGDWKNGPWGDIVFVYVNMGDSYVATIVHHRDKGFLVASWADLAEREPAHV